MLIGTVKSNALTAGMQKVIKVRNSNPLQPALECVHCKTIKGGIILTCSNLDSFMQTGIKADVAEIGKEFMIPMRAQLILQQLKDVDIEIINGQGLTFKYGDNVIKVTPVAAADFPTMPKPDNTVEFEIAEPAEMNRLLQMHKLFTSKDSLRPAMTGIYMTRKAMASTDAHMLCVSNVKALPFTTDHEFKIIISNALVNAFGAIQHACKVKLGKEHITVMDKETKIITRLIDSNFPQYSVVIPKDNCLHIKLNRLALLHNIKMAINIATKQTKMIVVTFSNGEYSVSATDIDFGEEISLKGECSFTKNDDAIEELAIGWNGQKLSLLLEQLSDEDVVLQVKNATAATIVQDKGTLLLLMPLMLNN